MFKSCIKMPIDVIESKRILGLPLSFLGSFFWDIHHLLIVILQWFPFKVCVHKHFSAVMFEYHTANNDLPDSIPWTSDTMAKASDIDFNQVDYFKWHLLSRESHLTWTGYNPFSSFTTIIFSFYLTLVTNSILFQQ